MKLGICNFLGLKINKPINSNIKELLNICNALNDISGVTCDVLNCTDKFNTYTEKSISRVSFLNNVTKDYNALNNSVHFRDVDPNSYDAILIMNSHANYYGGVENKNITDIFRFLAKFKGTLFYLFNDTNLGFRQLWTTLRSKKWNYLSEDDVMLKNKFVIISQFNDMQLAIDKNKNCGRVNIGNVYQLDFGRLILHNLKSKMVKNQSKYDLIYGGSFRGGSRAEKFADFFLNQDDLSVAIYGTMCKDNFKDFKCHKWPEFLGKIDSNKVINQNALGFSTVVCGDESYADNIVTIRVYESMLADCVTFIDRQFDSKHLISNNDFVYVSNGKELSEKILALKSDAQLLNNILQDQHEFLKKQSNYNVAMNLVDIIKKEA